MAQDIPEDPPESREQYMPEMRKVPTGSMIRPNQRTNTAGVQADETRICVVMVGLPARGKSLIAQKSRLHICLLYLGGREADDSRQLFVI